MKPHDLYSTVARCWAVVFFVVGLAFLFAPAFVGESLTQLAHALRLKGQIVAPAGNLFWVLALSLMSTITVLAVASAQSPEQNGPYFALMTAKLVSTAGFAGLSMAHGTAWLVCAGGDWVVALTLFLAHRRISGLQTTPRPVHE